MMHRGEVKNKIECELNHLDSISTRAETYDLKNQGMSCISFVDPWVKLCWYKLGDDPDGDCDVSLNSMVYYSLALGCKDRWGIVPQPKRLLNYQLEPREAAGGSKAGYLLRGDTMNSYATTFHRYLQLLDAERAPDERLNPTGGTWEEAVLSNFEAFDQAVSPAACAFIRRVHTIGNMIAVPCLLSESGKEVIASFNAPRYRRTKDYWDLTLLCICHHYTGQTVGGFTLEWLLPRTADCSLCRAWLDSFGEGQTGWNHFVEQNLLQDCVNTAPGGDYTLPKELWPGHFTGDILPNQEQCETFFANVNSRIAARGRRMVIKALETIKAREIPDIAGELLL